MRTRHGRALAGARRGGRVGLYRPRCRLAVKCAPPCRVRHDHGPRLLERNRSGDRSAPPLTSGIGPARSAPPLTKTSATTRCSFGSVVTVMARSPRNCCHRRVHSFVRLAGIHRRTQMRAAGRTIPSTLPPREYSKHESQRTSGSWRRRAVGPRFCPALVDGSLLLFDSPRQPSVSTVGVLAICVGADRARPSTLPGKVGLDRIRLSARDQAVRIRAAEPAQ